MTMWWPSIRPEVDLSGQIAADTIGYRQYSGTGGSDFVRALPGQTRPPTIIARVSTAAEEDLPHPLAHHGGARRVTTPTCITW